jgi:hypothetical protein
MGRLACASLAGGFSASLVMILAIRMAGATGVGVDEVELVEGDEMSGRHRGERMLKCRPVESLEDGDGWNRREQDEQTEGLFNASNCRIGRKEGCGGIMVVVGWLMVEGF